VGHTSGASQPACLELSQGLDQRSSGLPRVLVIVRGGVAEYVADCGVEVAIFDFDDYASDPELTEKAPAHFSDLAQLVDAPRYRTID